VLAQMAEACPLWFSLALGVLPGEEPQSFAHAQREVGGALTALQTLGPEGRVLARAVVEALLALPARMVEAQEGGASGLALWVGAGLDAPLWLGLPFAPLSGGGVEAEPLLEPLWVALEALDAVLAVCVDEEGARVCAVNHGAALALGRASWPWSSPETVPELALHDLTLTLARALAAREDGALVLLGDEPRVGALFRALPEGLRARVVGVGQGGQGARVASEALRALELGLLPKLPLAEEIVARAQALEGAVVGAQALWERQTRLAQACVTDQARAPGWRCAACGEASVGRLPPACTSCGAQVDGCDGVALLLERLAALGVPVARPEAHEALDALGGVGALLAG
jgi:hypothetical protein